MKQISILGCGWLGLPLAKFLVENGFSVNGSTTSYEKISLLEKNNIHPYLIRLSVDELEDTARLITHFLKNSTVLIINIPPKLRGNASENFIAKIQYLIPFIEKSSIEKVLFVSSTSVYADSASMSEVCTEETTPDPDNESGKQLLSVENLLLSNCHFQTTIVRFGGLIGIDRHPIAFLAGRKNIENPDAPINLIHQKDCIAILHKVIEDSYWNTVFNAVAPFHPTRKDYYTQKAIELDLKAPEFEHKKASLGKTISSEKLITTFAYTFKEPKL
jgi:nucleoside-diphosphate-sugar epimerase